MRLEGERESANVEDRRGGGMPIGIAGGGISIFFWKAAKYFIGAWGGLALALWIQCFRNGGLIGPIGFRWIMYIGACHPARGSDEDPR